MQYGTRYWGWAWSGLRQESSDSAMTVGLGEGQQTQAAKAPLPSPALLASCRVNRQQLPATSACKAGTTVGLPILILGAQFKALSLGSKDQVKIPFVGLERT